MSMEILKNLILDEERALYGIEDTAIQNVKFKGEKDGESALKECTNIHVKDCLFALRYPMWHDKNFAIESSRFLSTARAPLWYSSLGVINNVKMSSPKALRECSNIKISHSDIKSVEFGWFSKEVEVIDCTLQGEYLFFKGEKIHLSAVKFKGKYSFQYIDNLAIENSYLDTKDAFWHSNNIVCKNCVIKGEYLAWFSSNLTLINCRIIGTQPFCYCTNLTLIDCTMEGCDLAFEYSDVKANVIGHIDSIKNPKSGFINCQSVGQIIKENDKYHGSCDINILDNK